MSVIKTRDRENRLINKRVIITPYLSNSELSAYRAFGKITLVVERRKTLLEKSIKLKL